MHIQKVMTDERLWALFNIFDTDSSNYITAENLKTAFRRLGRTKLSDADIADIIKEHDIEENNQISFTEFKLIFAGEDERKKAKEELSPTFRK